MAEIWQVSNIPSWSNPVRLGRAGKGPLACSQAPIGSLGPWFSPLDSQEEPGIHEHGEVTRQPWPWVWGRLY